MDDSEQRRFALLCVSYPKSNCGLIAKAEDSLKNHRWNNNRMYYHYIYGNGRSVTLSEMGLSGDVYNLIFQDGFNGVSGNIHSRFIRNQIVKGDYTFSNSYNFGEEIVWAMGSGTLQGQFYGDVSARGNGVFKVVGKIVYEYFDIFEDPYDTFDWVPGKWDPNGIPYEITEQWTVNVNGLYKE